MMKVPSKSSREPFRAAVHKGTEGSQRRTFEERERNMSAAMKKSSDSSFDLMANSLPVIVIL